MVHMFGGTQCLNIDDVFLFTCRKPFSAALWNCFLVSSYMWRRGTVVNTLRVKKLLFEAGRKHKNPASGDCKLVLIPILDKREC